MRHRVAARPRCRRAAVLDFSRRARLCEAAESFLNRLHPQHFRETENVTFWDELVPVLAEVIALMVEVMALMEKVTALMMEVMALLAKIMALMMEVVAVLGGGHHVFGGGGI